MTRTPYRIMYDKEYMQRPHVKEKKFWLNRRKKIEAYRDKGKHKKPRFIYVLSNPTFPGWYKVGLSLDVETRVKNANTWNPTNRFKVEYKKLHPYAVFVETIVHREFKTLEGREWIKAPLEDIIEVIEMEYMEL